MAAPGTLLHVLEVAAQLAAAATEHADSLTVAAAVPTHSPPAAATTAAAP